MSSCMMADMTDNIDRRDEDVAVLGGGLAGLTLALQLRQVLPQLGVTVVEKTYASGPGCGS